MKATKYALDTNIYIQALRDAERLRSLKRFLLRNGTRVHMAAIVAMELRAGARTRALQTAVEELLEPYASRGLLITPTFDACVHAGRVVAETSSKGGDHPLSPRRLANDAVLAASCRESGVSLVTANVKDFAVIKRYLRDFEYSSERTVFV
jgi:predicted nucleic acid-binding protein